MIEEIDKLKSAPIPGQKYLVPCIPILLENWEKDRFDYYTVPVINHLHNDKENGQHEPHYHIDSRFVPEEIPYNYPKRIYPHEVPQFNVILIEKVCTGSREFRQTSTSLIKNSKLKHDCIYKGKCPHRGFDLSQVEPVNGVITCPLHGLQFDAITSKITNRPT